MSSENKTPNLELNQWTGNEYPKRTDFIEDNKKIDEAYKELKDNIKDGGKVSSVNGKIGDVILKAEDIKTESGDTVQSQMAEMTQQRKTYNELKELIENNKLIPGTQYVLTDYRTKYIQPTTEVLKEMEVEELVLTASSSNTFEPIVASGKYPKDIIYYDIDNNICEDKATPRNGFILRRYDPISKNDAPQDWRAMLWARYKPDAKYYYLNGEKRLYLEWNSNHAGIYVTQLYKADNKLWMAKNTNTPTSSTDTNVFYEVYPNLDTPLLINEKTKIAKDIELIRGDLVEVPTFGTGCNQNFVGSTEGMSLHNNVFIENSHNNMFLKRCYRNTINASSYGNLLGVRSTDNIFVWNCYENSLGNACTGNYFSTQSRHNSFNNDCRNNIIGASGFSNNFGNGCYSNSFGNGCFSNSFGNGCHSNSFGSGCYFNTFGNSFTTNSFGNYCNENSFDNGCTNNVFNDNCSENSFGNSCTHNKTGAYFQYNTIQNHCVTNSFGDYCRYNVLFNYVYQNTFGNYNEFIRVERMNSKDISNISDLRAKSQPTTITVNGNNKVIFWRLNASNQPVYTEIP